MPRFLILSLCLLISCGTTYKINGIKNQKYEEKQISNPYFEKIGKEYPYRFKITFMNKEIKGNFVVKKLDSHIHRAVMISDFGNTLFDLTLYDSDYTLNYAMPDLNKKIFIKTLVEDLQLIFKNDFTVNMEIETQNKTVLKSKNISLVYPNNETTYFMKLIRLKNNKIKTTNEFESTNSDFPEKIFIKHNNFNLTIELVKSKIGLDEN